MFDVAIPLVVELVLSAFYILPPSSSSALFVLVFLLIFFLAFSLRLPFLTVILFLECVRSTKRRITVKNGNRRERVDIVLNSLATDFLEPYSVLDFVAGAYTNTATNVAFPWLCWMVKRLNSARIPFSSVSHNDRP